MKKFIGFVPFVIVSAYFSHEASGMLIRLADMRGSIQIQKQQRPKFLSAEEKASAQRELGARIRCGMVWNANDIIEADDLFRARELRKDINVTNDVMVGMFLVLFVIRNACCLSEQQSIDQTENFRCKNAIRANTIRLLENRIAGEGNNQVTLALNDVLDTVKRRTGTAENTEWIDNFCQYALSHPITKPVLRSNFLTQLAALIKTQAEAGNSEELLQSSDTRWQIACNPWLSEGGH